MKLLIRLLRGVDEQPVDATLVSLTQKHVDHFTTQWQTALIESMQEDKYWDWAFKQRIADTYDNQEGYAIECNGDTQGLIMLETQQHRSVLVPHEPLVYVAALSSAPWNRKQIQNPPLFKRVGTLLLNFSRVRSLALGYKGRVGLHALPNAEGFYERRNMMRFDFPAEDYIDADDEPLPYFEYPPRGR
ncbi:MAG: hypothetical protein ACR2FS_09150 [Phormidesmis sp.]